MIAIDNLVRLWEAGGANTSMALEVAAGLGLTDDLRMALFNKRALECVKAYPEMTVEDLHETAFEYWEKDIIGYIGAVLESGDIGIRPWDDRSREGSCYCFRCAPCSYCHTNEYWFDWNHLKPIFP